MKYPFIRSYATSLPGFTYIYFFMTNACSIRNYVIIIRFVGNLIQTQVSAWIVDCMVIGG